MQNQCLFALLLGCALLGCGGSPMAMKESYNQDSAASSAVKSMVDGEEAVASGSNALGEVTNSAIANRKIIYNTEIGLVVDDYTTFESDLPALVASHGGFVSNSNTNRRYANSQSGTWVIRVPVEQYNAFLSGVSALGFAESRSEDAQDVTEEYVDVEVRIANKKKLEVRILTMLEERPGKLSDVLEIERELSRVREEIERMEGRLRFLKDRTSLATVTINCREQKEYVPPTAPTLRSRISESWRDSLGTLRATGENLLVVCVALLPWLVIAGAIWFVAVRVVRRWWRKRKAKNVM